MKQDFTMHIYKADRRCVTGMRPISRTVWVGRDSEGMARECKELSKTYPAAEGYFLEYFPVVHSSHYEFVE